MKTTLCILLLLICMQGVHAQSQNTFLGTSAGAQNTGNLNTFIGYKAGVANSNDYITAVGAEAGMKNSGGGNAFFGNHAGYFNKGSNNAFFGLGAGSTNFNADFVTAIGTGAGSFNEGSGGVFVGRSAGYNNKGLNNTAIGFNSGGNNSLLITRGMTGEHNTFLGALSGEKNTSGLHNTYIGVASGRNNKAGAYNTYLGMRAGEGSTGSNNVFIGYEAARTVTSSHKLVIAHNLSSSTPLITGDFRAGHVAIGGFGDTKFTLHVLGTAHTTGTFTSSDRRFKKNIQSIDKALEKVLAMKGVSYEFKKDVARSFPQGKTYGFIAQDVQKVLPAVVETDQEGYLALNYECFIPLLVEAFKEMNGEFQQLAEANENLRKEVELLKKIINRGKPFLLDKLPDSASIGLTENEADLFLEAVVLHQNSPNPFNQRTAITYEVNREAQQIALYVYDLTGKPVLQFTHLPAGKSGLTIGAGQLTPGMYLYSLLVDGKIADTKRMILTR